VKILVAVVVIAAAVVGGVVVFGGDGNTTTTGPSGSGTAVDPTTPELTFTTAKAKVVTVTPAQHPKALADAAEAASGDAVAAIDTVYTEGFLDPSSWEDGDYDDAWSVFTDAAGGRAEADVDALTAGTEAGSAYDTIEPVKATMRPRVIVDDRGRAVSVAAVVYFAARGVHADGSYTLFKSTGQYFLEPADGGWRIVAFDVRRADAEKDAPSTSTSTGGGSDPSATPTETAS